MKTKPPVTRMRALIDAITSSLSASREASVALPAEGDWSSYYDLAMHEERSRSMPVFVALAVAAHAVLFLLTFPSLPTPVPEQAVERRVITLQSYTPPPPPLKKRRQITRTITHRLPFPDPTPRDPEPIIEDSRPEMLLPDELDLDVQIGIPEPPPPPQIYEAGVGGVSQPTVIVDTQLQPHYPELARRVRQEGKVILRAVVRKDGSVGELETLRAPSPDLGFSSAALDAVSNWRYTPATFRGRPVDVMITVVVTFSLR